MPAIYSCPHPMNVAGPSKPLTKIHEALAKAYGGSGYKVCEPSKYPELVELNRLGDCIGPAFDDLAAWGLAGADLHFSAGDVFLGGGGASLDQMRLLSDQERYPGWQPPCGTLWFSSYWGYAQGVLREEYAKHGIQATPIHPYVAWRAEREQEESDFMIVPSEACKATYPKERQDKIHVAEFGVDTGLYMPPASRDWDAPKLRVLFPATNPLRKGLDYVLKAWNALPGKEKFEITITGGITGGSRIQEAPGIKAVGWVPDEEMRRLMQTHHVLLLPSLEEGQALASLEAMACGMPVIVTPNVGLPPADAGRPRGFVVQPRNATDIRSALLTAEANRGELEHMGAEARAFAEKRPWSRFTDRIVEILKEEVGE